MSDLNLNVDDLKDIEEAIKNTPETPCEEEDRLAIERYNKRKEEIAKFKEDLKKVEELADKDWAKVMIKSNARNMMIAQKIAADEIEETADTRRLTQMSEIGNAITAAAKTFIDIEHQEEQLILAKEKNEMRKKEISLKAKGGEIETTGVSSLGTGSTSDMLKLLKTSSIEDVEKEKKVS